MSPTNLQPVDYTSTQNDAWGFLQEIVNQSSSVIIGGLTGSGKTSLLKALVETIPESNETRTLLFDGQGEDELSSWRDTNKEYARKDLDNDCSIGTLLKEVLAEKPKRAIISEIRGDEVSDMIAVLEKEWTVMTTIRTSSLKTIPKQLMNLMASDPDSNVTAEKMLRRVNKALDYGIFVDTAYTDDTKTKRLHYIKEVVRYSNGQVVPIFTQTVENGEVTLIKESGFNAFMKSLDV